MERRTAGGTFPSGLENAFLAAFLILSLVLRIAALLSLKQSAYFDFLLWDERLYHNWALQIADGTFRSASVYPFAAFPAYLTAFIYYLFGPDVLHVRLLNIGLGVLTCFLVYRIGKNLSNRTVGLIAGFIAAVYEPFILYSIVPLKTTLSVFLFAVCILFFLEILKRPSPMREILLGVACGLLVNVRENFMAVVPVLFVFLFVQRFREGSRKGALICTVLFSAGLLASLSPFLVRNYRVAGELSLTSSQAGFNLYLGNNLQNPVPYYRPASFASSSPVDQAIQFVVEASRRAGKTLSSAEASRFWTAQVFSAFIDRPLPFLNKLLQKTLALFNGYEACDHYHIGFLSGHVPFFRLPLPGFWMVFPIGMAGMLAGLGSYKNRILLILFCLYGFTLVAFHPGGRYRLPMLIILVPFAAMTIRTLYHLVAERRIREIGVYASMIAAFFGIAFYPVAGSGDITAYLNTHAIVLDSKGREKEAMGFWEVSSEAAGAYSAFADLSLAGKHLKRGDAARAVFHLERIPDQSFAAAAKYELLGDLYISRRRFSEGVSAYERSIAVNSGQPRVRLKLFEIFRRTDGRRAEEERRKLDYVLSFYEGAIHGQRVESRPGAYAAPSR